MMNNGWECGRPWCTHFSQICVRVCYILSHASDWFTFFTCGRNCRFAVAVKRFAAVVVLAYSKGQFLNMPLHDARAKVYSSDVLVFSEVGEELFLR